jgi:SPP1 family predicted phage head-tail adaptor
VNRNDPGIGEFRQRVGIESPVDTLDDSGSAMRAYTPIGEVWAQVEASAGTSRFEAFRQESFVTHIVRIRWREDIQSQMRFVLGSRRLLIHAAFDPDERKKILVCHCEEIKC